MTAAGAQTGPWACQGTIAAHKGTIGRPPRGPGGSTGFSDLGKILVKPSPGRVWGEMATPKGFLGPLQTIPLAKNLGKTHGGPIPPQSYVFRTPFLGPQRAPGPSWAKMWGQGSKNGVRGQKYQSCVLKNHAESNGRCPKRKHMLQVMWVSVSKILAGSLLESGQPFSFWSNPSCFWGNPSLFWRNLSGLWGNPFLFCGNPSLF